MDSLAPTPHPGFQLAALLHRLGFLDPQVPDAVVALCYDALAASREAARLEGLEQPGGTWQWLLDGPPTLLSPLAGAWIDAAPWGRVRHVRLTRGAATWAGVRPARGAPVTWVPLASDAPTLA